MGGTLFSIPSIDLVYFVLIGRRPPINGHRLVVVIFTRHCPFTDKHSFVVAPVLIHAYI